MEEIVFILGWVFLGLAWGSFANVLQAGGGRKKLLGRSVCDGCGKRLNWWENVPVLSWAFLKGKSLCCQNPLSWQYPLVELLSGLSFGVWSSKFGGFTGVDFWSLTVVGILVLVLAWDLWQMIIPDWSLLFLFGLALVGLGAGFLRVEWAEALGAGLGALGFFLGLWFLTRGKGMGMGDVKMAGVMGIFLGFEGVAWALWLAFVSGALLGLFLMVLGRAGRKTALPFGPFLIFGWLLAWLGPRVYTFWR